MRKIKSMFCGLFWGAVIGGALVVLFTPYSGDELKHRVTDYVENVKDEVKRAGEENALNWKHNWRLSAPGF